MSKLINIGKTILIVEDNSNTQSMLSKQLRSQHYTTKMTKKGVNALKLVRKNCIDLVLLDIGLEDGIEKGFDVCEKIKTNTSTKSTRIIFLTGSTNQAYLKKAFDSGGDDFITKPHKESELLARVEYQLEQKENNAIHIVRIFIASSGKLEKERDKIELFFLKQNRDFTEKRVMYIVERYENYSTSINSERIQNKFNNIVIESDIVIAIIDNDVGPFTKEEFDVAHHGLLSGKKPSHIHVYFKSPPDANGITSEKLRKVEEFKKEIIHLEQIYDVYENIRDLKNRVENSVKDDVKEILGNN